MLSILIPVYNYKITQLVTDLFNTAINSNINFEIVVIEDGSTLYLKENSTVSDIKNVKYIALENNIGRAAIRNKLADTANGDFLLFLDCDTEVASEDFLINYLPFFKENTTVFGGTIYKKNSETKYCLAIKYGQNKEQFTEETKKRKRKFPVFATANFFIDKNIFKTVRFDENIKEYGHEDTVFGIDLQNSNFKIDYIDNPVYHLGLNDNLTYIKNNEVALNTLLTLYNSGKYPKLSQASKILKFFTKIKKIHLQKVIMLFFKIFKKLLIKKLDSQNPSLFLFDCYKIGYFCLIYEKDKKNKKNDKL